MMRVAAGVVAGALAVALAVAAEEITISTYYPSPRGVYDELRANKLILADAKAKKNYELTMDDGKLIVMEQGGSKKFIVIDIKELGAP